MGMRLAFVAVVKDFEGMFLAKGDERRLRVTGLGDGEHIKVTLIDAEGSDLIVFDESGVFPLPPIVRGTRMLIQKVRDGDTRSPTTVEILTNGNGTVSESSP